MSVQRNGTDRGLYNFGAVTSWVVLALILLFSCLSVALIALGGQVYRSIAHTAELNGSRRATISYVTGRFGAFDVENAMRVDHVQLEGEDVTVLVFSEDIDGDVYETRIYCVDGKLREQFVSADTLLESAQDGEAIAALMGFDVTLAPGLATLTFTQVNGEKDTIHAALRSSQEGAQ